MNGNNRQIEADRIQEETFRLSGDDREGGNELPGDGQWGATIFELIKIRQPAAAWALGWMAGWPEMRRVNA